MMPSELELLADALHELELPAPGEVVAGRERESRRHDALGVAHVAAQVAPLDVHVHRGDRERVVGLHGHRPLHHVDRRDLAERNLDARHGGDHDAAELLRIVAQLPRVAHVHFVALPPFNGDGRGHAAGGGHHRVVQIARREAEAGRLQMVEVDVHVVT